MQIVIDIDENLYTRLFDNGTKLSLHDELVLETSIRHGTPIPKGHGRLIIEEDGEIHEES